MQREEERGNEMCGYVERNTHRERERERERERDIGRERQREAESGREWQRETCIDIDTNIFMVYSDDMSRRRNCSSDPFDGNKRI